MVKVEVELISHLPRIISDKSEIVYDHFIPFPYLFFSAPYYSGHLLSEFENIASLNRLEIVSV